MSKAIPDGFIPSQALKEPYNNITMQGTWLASGTVTLPAFTAGGDITGAAGSVLKLAGATSGVVTIKVAAAAGTWTITLPTAVGTGGYQLTDAAGDGVCSWTGAGSLREWKNILGLHDPKDSLNKILRIRAYDFTFKEGKGTGDAKTLYTGVVADGKNAAPWAMHFGGQLFNPISAFGHTVGAIQELHHRLEYLERQDVSPVS